MGSDPSYPLFPVVCFLTTFMLLLVLTTSAARQSWNLGVTFLCLWISLLNFTTGINAIIWADNADIKALGAAHVFDYKDPDVISKIKETAGGNLSKVYEYVLLLFSPSPASLTSLDLKLNIRERISRSFRCIHNISFRRSRSHHPRPS